MNRPLRLAVCSLPYICAINEYCGMFVAIHLRYPFRYFYLLYPTFCHVHPVGVGADSSCSYPRNSTKWRCIFASLILQFIVSYPRNCIKWRCNSHHFDISKPFGLDCKTGAMNRPLRLAVCSLPYICAINEYCGMFVAIHLRYPFRYFYLLYPTFCHVHPVGVGVRFIVPVPTKFHKMALRIPIVDIVMPLFLFIVPHVLPRPPRRRRGPIYRARAHEHPPNGVAVFHHWHCNTSYRVHEHPPNGVAIRNISYIKTDRKKREATP